jgi:phosphonate transport system permease protein
VALGQVGAGGIGIEVKVAMEMFGCRQSAMTMLCVFRLLLLVEQLSGAVRGRFIFGP